MRILVWQWGRFGAGPRVAVELAEGLRAAGATVTLSLAAGAEILDTAGVWAALTVRTYDSSLGFGLRLLASPLGQRALARKVAAFRPDVALCAMPALLDGTMADVLHHLGIPFAAIVHDADLHPGDGVPFQMRMQRRLMRQADALVALTAHVEAGLREQLGPRMPPLLRGRLPPFRFDERETPPTRSHGGPLRLLSFGRLLPYKGLDLLADALERLGPTATLSVRVVGQGPESPTLARLRTLPGVAVENRWVPETEIGALLAWSDALVLPYREASQSGVAAAAISARRQVVATRVGGLVEQFAGEPLAIMCEPDGESIAAAIERLVAEPPPARAGSDPMARWHDDTRDLLEGLARLFPAGAGSDGGRAGAR